MRKPVDYDQVQAYGSFEKLELGGHVCTIRKVEETRSKNNNEMLRIYLDIAEGPQAGYYERQYRQDDRPDKKWPCIVYQVSHDSEGKTNKGFKTFMEAVKKSNPGFDDRTIWDEQFGERFKGLKVGGAFGREQYRNHNGELKWATKCMQFWPVDEIRKGVEVPEDKCLEGTTSPGYSSVAAAVPPPTDDDLPF